MCLNGINKQSGKEVASEIKLTVMGKIGAGVITSLLAVGALGVLKASMTVDDLRRDVSEIKETINDIQRRQIASNRREIADLRDRVGQLEGGGGNARGSGR